MSSRGGQYTEDDDFIDVVDDDNDSDSIVDSTGLMGSSMLFSGPGSRFLTKNKSIALKNLNEHDLQDLRLLPYYYI